MTTPRLKDIDWQHVQTILVDMDGTLLDLAFDTRFWLHTLPGHIARQEGLAHDIAVKRIVDHAEMTRGTLKWYCLDHWSEEMGIDVRAVKQSQAHLVKWLPGAGKFIAALKTLAAEPWLATNAHPFILAIKQQQVQVQQHFVRTVTSQDFNAPKEAPEFWQAMTDNFGLDLGRCVMIDDSVDVLCAAKLAGVGHAIEIMRPDSDFGKSTSGAAHGHSFIEADSVADIAGSIVSNSAA